MDVDAGFEVILYNEKNESISGVLTIEDYQPAAPIGGTDQQPVGSSSNSTFTEKDPEGAVTYVVSVILIYGLAIIFLIASHVFVKKKEERLENQLRFVDKYFQQVHSIRDRGERESYKQLKKSIVPVIANSSAKDLISRRKSFAPILAKAGIVLNSNGSNERLDHDPEKGIPSNAKPYITMPPFLELPNRGNHIMPAITEEVSLESEETDFTLPGVHRSQSSQPAVNYSAFSAYGINNDYRIPPHVPSMQSHTIPRIQVSCASTDELAASDDAIRETSIVSSTFSVSDPQDLTDDSNLLSAYQSHKCLSIESLTSDVEEGLLLNIPQASQGPGLYQMTWVSDRSLDSSRPSETESAIDQKLIQEERKQEMVSPVDPKYSNTRKSVPGSSVASNPIRRPASDSGNASADVEKFPKVHTAGSLQNRQFPQIHIDKKLNEAVKYPEVARTGARPGPSRYKKDWRPSTGKAEGRSSLEPSLVFFRQLKESIGDSDEEIDDGKSDSKMLLTTTI